jgi:hypothetical protein
VRAVATSETGFCDADEHALQELLQEVSNIFLCRHPGEGRDRFMQ